jgi:hypothetical protein
MPAVLRRFLHLAVGRRNARVTELGRATCPFGQPAECALGNHLCDLKNHGCTVVVLLFQSVPGEQEWAVVLRVRQLQSSLTQESEGLKK